LNVPSLKERKDDIPLLINHFTTLMYQNFGILKKFSHQAIDILKTYSWPGNIRELKNIVERIAVNTLEDIATEKDIPEYILEDIGNYHENTHIDCYESKGGSLKDTLQEIERKIIKDTLVKCAYNKAETSRILGIPRMTLYRKLKEMGVSTHIE
ncbi:helix-turn-helix domain-containing protein, partial [Anaerosolibacter sp.]|uniref:helix-turn-helix domain-containing protein n=1 Tax=Anaerosolibacter sp. TaxID=1872527 RepID=UPI0039EEC4DE